MSDIAIKVENLGKKYMIRHKKQEPYKTFQDALIQGGKKIIDSLNPFAPKSKEEENIEEFWALKEINFEIKQGDKVGIIGRNGAGKSTLLKVLSRITEPTTGKIQINGRIASLLEVGTGFHPELTGRENIYLNGAILGMSRAEIKSKFDEIVAFAEVEKFLDTPVKRYSSGMYVRLAFSVAAHLEPEILVVDEVLAVGDVEFQKKCLGKMGEVSKEGRTILFVSHNMNAVEQLCNKALLMNQGQLVKNSDDVQALIHYYLNENSEGGLHAKWENSGGEYRNPYFCPQKFYIVDDNENLVDNYASNDDDIFITIEGEIEEIHNALCVGYALFDENNNLLYWTYATDQEEKYWPKLEKGSNILKSQLPKHLLNEGVYRIELLISLHYISWIVEPQKNAPAIFVKIQGGLSKSPYWMVKRPGILAPIIPWSLA